MLSFIFQLFDMGYVVTLVIQNVVVMFNISERCVAFGWIFVSLLDFS